MANEIARKLRKTMTPHEVKLWVHLRKLKEHGYHFRRQVPIKPYIVDFACKQQKLVIELDGSQHAEDEHAAKDIKRDADLTDAGYYVLRIWNQEIDTNLEGVIEGILHLLEERS